MLKYSEVKAQGLVDGELLDTVPSVCKYCGSEVEFSDNLVTVSCPNRYCSSKIAQRIVGMCECLDVAGWGFATALRAVEKFELKAPAQLYVVAQHELECSEVSGFQSKLRSFLTKVAETDLELWEYVKYMQLPYISNTAQAIFNGFKSIEEAYVRIHTGQVQFIMDRLDMSSNSEGSLLAVRIYNTLLEYEVELTTLAGCFSIKEITGKTVSVCITGRVDGFVNKKAYIAHLNSKYSALNIILIEAATKCDILICDESEEERESSKKYLKAIAKNKMLGEDKIKICNSKDCIDYLGSLCV